MLSRIVSVLVFVPLGVVLVALAVANRAPTPFTLDPFNPGNPPLTAELPLFVWLFAALISGLLVGSVASWLKGGRHRKRLRERDAEVLRLREQARVRPPSVVVAPAAMPAPSGPAVPLLAKPAA